MRIFFFKYESIFSVLWSSHHICSSHPPQSGFHSYIPLKYAGKDVEWSFNDYIQGVLSSLHKCCLSHFSLWLSPVSPFVFSDSTTCLFSHLQDHLCSNFCVFSSFLMLVTFFLSSSKVLSLLKLLFQTLGNLQITLSGGLTLQSSDIIYLLHYLSPFP